MLREEPWAILSTYTQHTVAVSRIVSHVISQHYP